MAVAFGVRHVPLKLENLTPSCSRGSRPSGSSSALFFDGVRKAQLPLCASASEAARIDPQFRLAECDAEHAKALQPRT